MAGDVEAWGRGIEVMQERCREYGIPDPLIAEEQGGIEVTFQKDIYTEEYLRILNLDKRQVQAVLYVKEHGRITNAEYRELTAASDRTVLGDLDELMGKHVFRKNGATGKKSNYSLIF